MKLDDLYREWWRMYAEEIYADELVEELCLEELDNLFYLEEWDK